MMKRIRWFLLGGVLLAHAALANPAVTFVLDPPTGVLAGAQGTSVGWGYTITVAEVGFLTIKGISFEDQTPVGNFWMTEFPSTTISNVAAFTEPWVPGLNGLQYDIDLGAPFPGQTVGTMDLTYQFFQNADLTGDLGIFDVYATNGSDTPVIAEVNVQPGAPSTIPEPGALWLAGSALVALILRRKVTS